MIPIVDTHQHLWDLGRFRLPWVDDMEVLNWSFLMADYLEATLDLNVVKTIYMEVDVDPAQQTEEAEYVTELCRNPGNPMVAAVISGRPQSPGFAAYLDRFRDNPLIKGLRQVLHTQPLGLCVERDFIRGVRLLGDRDLSFDLCCLPADLANGVRLVDQCPDTRFVLDHCGNANVDEFGPGADAALRSKAQQWKRDIGALAERANVICKISGIVVRAGEGWSADDLAPLVDHCLDSFGPDRVVFGGDWPVCTVAATYRQWVEALKQIVESRSEQEQRNLFHDNAVGFYGLGG